MKDYVVQSGTLQSFDHIWERRMESIKGLADYPAIELTAKSMSESALDQYKREPEFEFAFLKTLLASILKGHSALYGFRDVMKRKGHELMLKLKSQNKISWSHMPYWGSDDDLVLLELKDFHEDMDFLGTHYPPAEGEVFFYLSNQIFDVFDIYWQRRARTANKISQHPKEEMRKDPFHSDIFGFANQSLVVVHCDREGTFTIVHHPDHLDDDTFQGYITGAGMKAQMNITFAPGLFS